MKSVIGVSTTRDTEKKTVLVLHGGGFPQILFARVRGHLVVRGPSIPHCEYENAPLNDYDVMIYYKNDTL